MDSEIQLLLIGQTGVGKSSLGNFLLRKDVFQISDKNECCTKTVNICSNKGLTIIDTPCLGGKEKDEVEILKTIMNYVKLMRQFKGILILFNSFEFRVSDGIMSMIKNFCNVFGSEII